MTDKQPNKTYIIQHKETKEMFIARSGKSSWKQPGHAKNAWNQSIFGWNLERYGLPRIVEPKSWDDNYVRVPKFDEQDVFEVVELKHKAQSDLEEAIELLNHIQGRCDSAGWDMIEDFLKRVKL